MQKKNVFPGMPNWGAVVCPVVCRFEHRSHVMDVSGQPMLLDSYVMSAIWLLFSLYQTLEVSGVRSRLLHEPKYMLPALQAALSASLVAAPLTRKIEKGLRAVVRSNALAHRSFGTLGKKVNVPAMPLVGVTVESLWSRM